MPTYNDNNEKVCEVCDDPQHTTHSHEQFCQEHASATSCEGLQQNVERKRARGRCDTGNCSHECRSQESDDEVRCIHGVILTYDDCLNCDKEEVERKQRFPSMPNYIVTCHCGFESEVSGEDAAQQEVTRHESQCTDKNPNVYACELDD